MATTISNNHILFDNGTIQTAYIDTSVKQSMGQLLFTLDNPNAYDTGTSDYFGIAVAISGDYAVVGAYQEDDTGGTGSGKVYVYNVRTGVLLYTLSNPNAYSTSADDQFGYAVAISNKHVVVGAFGEDDAEGADGGIVYVYDLSSGSLLWRLTNPDPFGTTTADYFGYSVAISGKNVIVSAYQEDQTGGSSSGKAYIFDITTGSLSFMIDNPNTYSTVADDFFGRAVAMDGNYAIVGAHQEDDSTGANSGKAYIFNVTTGALIQTLNNPNAYSTGSIDWFGRTVDISGNYAIVSAYLEDDNSGGDSGKAYIFNATTGALVHTLNNPNPYGTSLNDYFGISVAISGNYAIVSANSEDGASGADAGKVYIFNVTTGALVFTIDNPNAYNTNASDFFGSEVAVSGNYAIIGTPSEDSVAGFGAGKAYIFSIAPIYNVNTSISKITSSIGFESLNSNTGVFQTAYVGGQLAKTIANPNAFSTRAGDAFGLAVAIYGNYAIVGARQEDDAGGASSGKAYIFDVTTGALVQTLNNPNAYSTSAGDVFGWTVAISDKYAAVGAFEDDSGGADSGKVYIFDITTGILVTTLSNPNAYSTSADDQFGIGAYGISISGNYVIVGAHFEDDSGGAGSGKAYIFNATTGALIWTLNNPNAYSTSAGDVFGAAVAISGSCAIVGAWAEDDSGGSSSGKAYIFDVNTGTLLRVIDNPSAYGSSNEDYFGFSVAISGNYAIVGAYQEGDTGGGNSGKAYIFNATTGALVQTLNNPNAYDTSTADQFGYAVSISGNYAMVSTSNEDDAGGSASGKAYIFNATTGALLYTLNNPNAYSTSSLDGFGGRSAISGKYAIVGASNEEDTGGADSGKAYIFSVEDQTYLDKLVSMVS